jgi:VIT1/CCC1 family predicted Fe2+/Mn2+ transporter
MRLPDRVLEPVERLSEILFGLIMALTITSAVSVATADQNAIRAMLIAALGCNIAWGIIDAGMYLMARIGERGRTALAVHAVREAVNPEDAHRIIADELPALLAPVFQPSQLELIREEVNRIPVSKLSPRLSARDWRGALGVCVLVILSTFPLVIPFLFIADARVALRISNALAIVLLFVCGFLFGRHAGLRPMLTGLVMVAVGVALVSMAIALGG